MLKVMLVKVFADSCLCIGIMLICVVICHLVEKNYGAALICALSGFMLVLIALFYYVKELWMLITAGAIALPLFVILLVFFLDWATFYSVRPKLKKLIFRQKD